MTDPVTGKAVPQGTAFFLAELRQPEKHYLTKL